jgi:hypothetical protein
MLMLVVYKGRIPMAVKRDKNEIRNQTCDAFIVDALVPRSE